MIATSPVSVEAESKKKFSNREANGADQVKSEIGPSCVPDLGRLEFISGSFPKRPTPSVFRRVFEVKRQPEAYRDDFMG